MLVDPSVFCVPYFVDVGLRHATPRPIRFHSIGDDERHCRADPCPIGPVTDDVTVRSSASVTYACGDNGSASDGQRLDVLETADA